MRRRTEHDERAVVALLGSLQVGKLATRRDRGHWSSLSLSRLTEMASDELQELADALDTFRLASTPGERRKAAAHVLDECADVANIVSFIAANVADRTGARDEA